MQKKLTITVDERLYKGLHSIVGQRRVSQFTESLVRLYVPGKDLERAYQLLSAPRDSYPLVPASRCEPRLLEVSWPGRASCGTNGRYESGSRWL